ncbi:MAG: ion channel [Bacteroidia bacterium]|jgi:inward rectifier potassium channel|nr:ion channel [Bacteroidia bacterium]
MATIRFSNRKATTTGFGTQASNQGERLVRKDGSYNVIRSGMPFSSRFNHYHDLITMKWWKFYLLVITFYTSMNILFALIFMAVGMEQIEGDLGLTTAEHFWDAFFFSSQTMTTVGYGRTSPIGFAANLVAAIECLIGLMSFAILTGVLYGRFSRPRAKLASSDQAVIAPFEGGTALMFRIANARSNQLIECEAQLLMSYIDRATNRREFETLTLEYNKISALALSWTVVHPIVGDSPLVGLSLNDLKEMDCEFVCNFKGFDETYSQVVYTRISYNSNEIVWGAKFTPMFHRAQNSAATVLEVDKVGDYELMALPTS